VLSVAAAGVLLPFTAGQAARVEGARRTLAAKLASDLIEQITLTPFEQIVPDYDGYVEPAGQVRDASGAVFSSSNYAGLSRQASCRYVYMPQESGLAEPQYILVTVTVKYRGKPLAALSRLVSE